MTKSLEKVVRPFQAGDVFTARVLPPTQPPVTPPTNTHSEWGGPIQLIAKAIGVRDLNTGGKHWSEVSRTSHVVRVTNPTDPEQYVDVERTTAMHLVDETGADHYFTFSQNPLTS